MQAGDDAGERPVGLRPSAVTAPAELSSVVAEELRDALLRSAGLRPAPGAELVLDLRATRLCDVEALSALLELAVELRASGQRVAVWSHSDLLRAVVAGSGLAVQVVLPVPVHRQDARGGRAGL